jgi:hypothetical protein
MLGLNNQTDARLYPLSLDKRASQPYKRYTRLNWAGLEPIAPSQPAGLSVSSRVIPTRTVALVRVAVGCYKYQARDIPMLVGYTALGRILCPAKKFEDAK